MADLNPLAAAAQGAAQADEAAVTARPAVIDIGSNSLRLVVFDGSVRAPLPIFNEKVMCGIGRKLLSTGRLDPDGVELALANMPRFAAAAEALSVTDIQVVATSAVRDAADGREFVTQIEELTGLPVRILSGEEEAYYSALGVLASMPYAEGVIGDLGGGSLELVRVKEGRPADSVTLPLGALRLNELRAEGKELQPYIKQVLADVPWLGDVPGQTFFAVGGAWRTIGRVHAAQTRYRLRILDTYSSGASGFRDFLRLIAQQNPETLVRMPEVSSKRAATLPAAALLLRRLLKVTGAARITFSASGLREGLLFDRLSAAERMEDPLVAAAATIGQRFGRFADLSPTLIEWIGPVFGEQGGIGDSVIAATAHLGDIGWSDHPDYRALHTLDRVLTLPIAGTAHRDRVMMALALFARYGGTLDKVHLKLARDVRMDDDAVTAALALGQALRLGYALSAGHPRMLKSSRLRREEGRLVLQVPARDPAFTGETISKRLGELASTLGLEAHVAATGPRGIAGAD